MVDESRYTLYSEPSFVLATLPAGVGQDDFWDALRDRLSEGGSLAIYPEASGRMLRVVRTEHGVWTAYHFGVHQARQPQAIRLQPQTAWHQKLGHDDEVEPMLAGTARTRLPAIRQLLTDAAANVDIE